MTFPQPRFAQAQRRCGMGAPDSRGRSCLMPATKMQNGALITREAYSALLNLKSLVERAVDTAHQANIETIGKAIRPQTPGDPLRSLRTAAQTTESSVFENAISDARTKI